MRTKTWLYALMISASAFAMACNESATQDLPVDEEVTTYYLTCQSSQDCTLTLEANQEGIVSMLLSSVDSTSNTSFVADAEITGTKVGGTFSLMDGTSDIAKVKTDATGVAKFRVKGGETEGTGVIEFVEPFQNQKKTFTVIVKAAPVEEPPVVKDPVKVQYEVGLGYAGDKDIDTASVVVFEGKKCADIIKDEMTSDEIKAIGAGKKDEKTEVFDGAPLSSKKFGFEFEEVDPVSYAVFGRGKEGKDYVAYGCVDNMNSTNKNVTVNLKDAKVTSTEPTDPVEPPPVIPIDPVEDLMVSYGGSFKLMSQFNALSLLPHANTENGAKPLFKDMLAGDWVQFVLDFLSNPEKELPNILTQQLLPLLTDAEWFRNLLSKIPTIGETIVALLDTMEIDDLLETFGAKKIIEDYLTQLTDNITWWNDAKGGVQMANQIATNFTLYGTFGIANEDPVDGVIANNSHNYSSVLYHNGTLDKCYVGKEFGKDVDGKIICEIPIDSNEFGSVKGKFNAEFSEIASDAGTANIMTHSLTLAYGKLIYASLIQVLPTIIAPDAGVQIDTLGDLLAYYIGMGAVALYNKNNPDAQIEEQLAGCDAVGEVLVRILNDLVADKLGDFGKLIEVFVNRSALSGLCSTGVHSLDSLIDEQLDKLSVSNDRVTFTGADCNVGYVSSKTQTRLAYFGQPDYVWGSKVDKRCNWKVSIQASEDSEAKTIDGKFFATTSK